jgi:AcrR family transcriptional regulator
VTPTAAADPAGVVPAGAPDASGGRSADGRSTRWEAHRRARRAELVDAALRAIGRHGAGVGMDEIAAEAGTSKTVLYRHFTDKEQLYLAVAARVDRRVVGALRRAILATSTSRDALGAAIATYLRLVQDDPQVYRFVVQRPGIERLAAADPVSGLTAAISQELARLIAHRLRDAGIDTRAAAPWAHGLVGMVRAAADHWMSQASRTPTALLAEQLTDLAWGGLAAVLDRPLAGPDPLAGRPAPRPSAPPRTAPLEEEHA